MKRRGVKHIGRLAGMVCLALLFVPLVAVFYSDLSEFARRLAPELHDHIPVREGRLDLSDSDLSRSVPLDGEWEFAWGRMLGSSDELWDPHERFPVVAVPGVWHELDLDGEPLGRHGFGTYRLRLKVPPNAGQLYFHATGISSSFRFFVNGDLLSHSGDPGIDRPTTLPAWGALVAGAEPVDGEVVLLLEVANFHHARGGLLSEISVSAGTDGIARLARYRETGWFIFGGLLLMGLHHILLYAQRNADRSTLWFGAAVVLMAVRTLATSPSYLIAPQSVFGFEVLMNAEYVPVFLGMPLLLLYTRELFEEEVSRQAVRVFLVIGCVLTAVTLATPARIASHLIPGAHPVTVAISAYILVIAVRAVYAGRGGALLFFGGIVLLALAGMNDIAFNIGVVRTGYVSHAGLLVFLFFHSLVLSGRFADRDRTVYELGSENQRLEELTIKDGLTGISNRRWFDEILSREWEQAVRGRHHLSLLMIDIDRFKQYNDEFGHIAGDQALRSVAQTLIGAVDRSTDFLARYGGEEFAVILPHTDKVGARYIAERIRSAVADEDEDIGGNQDIAITVSVGVATATPTPGDISDMLVLHADRALYSAKRNGRNRVESE